MELPRPPPLLAPPAEGEAATEGSGGEGAWEGEVGEDGALQWLGKQQPSAGEGRGGPGGRALRESSAPSRAVQAAAMRLYRQALLAAGCDPSWVEAELGAGVAEGGGGPDTTDAQRELPRRVDERDRDADEAEHMN